MKTYIIQTPTYHGGRLPGKRNWQRAAALAAYGGGWYGLVSWYGLLRPGIYGIMTMGQTALFISMIFYTIIGIVVTLATPLGFDLTG
jgi:hypothetical protein